MSEARVSHIDEIDGIHGGIFTPVGRVLGVTAFGVNVENFPAGHDRYPDHDHSADGQEEVYLILSGRATLTIDDEDHPMRPGSIAFVPAGTSRRITNPDSDVQILAIGGNPQTPFSEVLAARAKAANAAQA